MDKSHLKVASLETLNANLIRFYKTYEQSREKTCLCHMRTTKAQIKTLAGL